MMLAALEPIPMIDVSPTHSPASSGVGFLSHSPIQRLMLCLGVLCFTLATPQTVTATDPPEAQGPTTSSSVSSEDLPHLVDQPLEDALRLLAERGLPVIFTDQLVPSGLRVRQQPRGRSPQAVLMELLAPHGLTAERTASGRWLVVPAAPRPAALSGRLQHHDDGRGLAGVRLQLSGQDDPLLSRPDGSFTWNDLQPGSYELSIFLDGFLPQQHRFTLAAGEHLRLEIDLQEIPVSIGQIEVTTQPPGLLGEGLSSLTLVQDELRGLPHFGDQALRGLIHLPGTAGNDLSAQLNVRGGRADEVMVRLDGLEIFEAYHLPDFGNAFSVFAAETLQRVDLLTGGFPVEYGDRMGGVLDITTLDPSWRRSSHLGFSVYQLRSGQSGRSDRGHLAYVASLRVGSFELPLRLADEEENPRFGDAFGKLDWQLDPRTDWRFHLLATANRLDFTETEEDLEETFRTEYRNIFGWAAHSVILGDSWLLRSQLAASRIARDRRGLTADPETGFDLADLRRLNSFSLLHEADWRRGRHFLEWGLEARDLSVHYDYTNRRSLDDSLAFIRRLPRSSITRFERDFDGQHFNVYLSDRLEMGSRASLEMGLRFDENSITDDHHLSPRLHFTYALSSRSLLRGAWGQYNQSQRVYELEVQDGESLFSRAERSQHRILGYERVFGEVGSSKPVTLRLEAYDRRIDNPRTRFENLFEPISIVPELEADRVRVDADSSRSRGVELFLGGPIHGKLDGFITYTYARTTDQIGGREVPRPYDQPHAVGLDLSWKAPWQWTVQAAWRYHSGWPTTAIETEDVVTGDGGSMSRPVLGPLYGDRLPHYQRLDIRLQRNWLLKRGELAFYLDIQNATNSENLRGFEVELEERDGGLRVKQSPNSWGGRLPSLGLTWTF